MGVVGGRGTLGLRGVLEVGGREWQGASAFGDRLPLVGGREGGGRGDKVEGGSADPDTFRACLLHRRLCNDKAYYAALVPEAHSTTRSSLYSP